MKIYLTFVRHPDGYPLVFSFYLSLDQAVRARTMPMDDVSHEWWAKRMSPCCWPDDLELWETDFRTGTLSRLEWPA